MIVVLDTETTGISKLDEVIQLALFKLDDSVSAIKASLDLTGFNTPLVRDRVTSTIFPKLPVSNRYFNPTVAINPHAQAVHGLSKIKLCKYDAFDQALTNDFKLVIAHNAPFDTRMLKLEGINAICTMGLAKKIEKLQGGKFGFDNYKLGTLYKFFYPEQANYFDTEFHDALADCEMCLLVLIALLDAFPFLQTLTEIHQYFWIDNK